MRERRFRAAVASFMAAAVVASAPGGGERHRGDQRACPVTATNHRIPPGQNQNPGADQAPYYGNGRLWTLLYPGGVREPPRRDGSIREKFPWWRAVTGQLTITGQRLDAQAPGLRTSIPDGYGLIGFQATGLMFPTAGCWRVTGSVGRATLSFVTLVYAG